jgi:predicted N-acetyltransferase YhbS
VRLLRATDAQKTARDALTAQVWAGPLTTARFLERERALRSHPWASRMTTWLWCAENGDVLSSCETFVSEAFVGARPCLAATIASVFTEPHLRGRGSAEAMLRAVIDALRGEVQAFTLFSEIGPTLYARLGFQPVPSFDVTFAPSETKPDVEWVTQIAPLPPAADGVLQLVTTPERFDWQLVREDFYGHRLDVHGARDGDASMTWTAYWKAKELQVLTYSRPTEKLLAAARYTAFRAGLPLVRVWETTPVPGGKRVSRDDELPMFLATPDVRGWSHIERAHWA